MRDGLLEQIKSKAYWRINFRPSSMPEPLLSLPRCNEIVALSSVELRGWDYPHVSRRKANDSGFGPAGDYYEHWVAWQSHLEFWRMFRSSQFLHYRALWEDWEDWTGDDGRPRPPGGISVRGVIWLWTEVFEFLFRLHRNGLYSSGVGVELSLENTAGRQIWISEGNRIPFSYERVSGAPRIAFSFELPAGALSRADHDVYRPQIIDFFEHFDWTPSEEVIASDQQKLLTKSY